MKTITLFETLSLSVSDENWDFLCKYRFFTNTPSIEDVQREFITGTGITPNKQYLWNNANTMFEEYISDLRLMIM